MPDPACKECIELETTNKSGECLFDASFKDHAGNPRRVFFYSQDHDTAKMDLRVLSETFEPLSIGQLIVVNGPSNISREEARRRIESKGGIIVDEEAFREEFPE